MPCPYGRSAHAPVPPGPAGTTGTGYPALRRRDGATAGSRKKRLRQGRGKARGKVWPHMRPTGRQGTAQTFSTSIPLCVKGRILCPVPLKRNGGAQVRIYPERYPPGMIIMKFSPAIRYTTEGVPFEEGTSRTAAERCAATIEPSSRIRNAGRQRWKR